MRTVALLGAAASVMATTSVAHAQMIESAAARQQRQLAEKDGSVTIEARIGGYRPDVDDNLSPGPCGVNSSGVTVNKTPYACTFGDGFRFQIGAEVDWQAIHIQHFGSLSLGGLVGFTEASGAARATDLSNTQAISEEVKLSLWTLSALAVLRIDVVARETWLPLVPYAKFGPAIGLWTSSNGSGTSHYIRTSNGSTPDGELGAGRTNGFVGALGVMFLIDALDRQAAQTFAVEQGILHTYMFGEFTVSELNGIGQTNAMHVGDTTWNAGFAVEL